MPSHDLTDWGIVTLFVLVWLGMVLGGLPRLKLDRSGVALLGAIGPLFVAGVGLSNLVSNVPAVMLLLPHLQGFEAGLTLALVSTLAGNLLLVGSIANLIVVDLAQQSGVTIDWRMHARVGVPVTLLTLAVVWGWLNL